MGLTFLTPWLLGGTALIAAPIVLHLLMRRQPVPFDFPALRFVQQREHTNRRSLRLRHWLLLAARCLLIGLLALALARPTFQHSGLFGSADAPVAAVFLFETSPRLEYRQENQPRLAAAREIADWLLNQLPPESEVGVLETSRQTGDFAPDLIVAKQRIEALKVSAAQQPLLNVLESALQLVRSNTSKARREVYLFTDLARSSWPAQAAERMRELKQKYEEVSLYLIDVGVQEPRNTTLGEVRLSAQVIPQQGSLTLEVPVERVGPDEEVEATMYLLDTQGQLVKKGQALRAVKSGQPELLQFRLTDLPAGTHQGIVRLQQDDALAVDNTRYFTVEARAARRVLIVAPDPADSYAFFLEQTLDPTPQRRAGLSPFKTLVISQAQLAKQELTDFAAVCLLDPLPLDGRATDKLRDYVQAGGGLAIWLGHNAVVGAFNEEPLRELMPGTLELQWAAGNQELFLAPDDLQHPILQKFREVESSIPWLQGKIFRLWKFSQLDAGVTVIVRLNNHLPALIEKPLGRGRVLLMTTPISEAANDLQTWNLLGIGVSSWPSWLLTIQQLNYLTGSSEERFNYLAGEEVVLQIPEAERGLTYSLSNPAADTITPTLDQALGTLRSLATEYPGHYQLRAGGTVQGVRRGWSVNLPNEQTQLARISKAELDTMLGEGNYRLARTRDEIDRTVSTGRTGTELFPLLMLLVALLLGGEFFLSTRFYRQPNSDGETKTASLAGFAVDATTNSPATPTTGQAAPPASTTWPTRPQAPAPQPVTSGWQTRA